MANNCYVSFFGFFLVICTSFSYILFPSRMIRKINSIKGLHMKSPDDIWGELGELPGEELMHVLTKLFTLYEDRLKTKQNLMTGTP